jgi:hypothetical protein
MCWTTSGNKSRMAGWHEAGVRAFRNFFQMRAKSPLLFARFAAALEQRGK